MSFSSLLHKEYLHSIHKWHHLKVIEFPCAYMSEKGRGLVPNSYHTLSGCVFALLLECSSVATKPLRAGRTESEIGVPTRIFLAEKQQGLEQMLWFPASCGPWYHWGPQEVGNDGCRSEFSLHQVGRGWPSSGQGQNTVWFPVSA